MSIESAKAFLERVRNDEDFRKAVGEIVTAEERMEFVKGARFDFTNEDLTVAKDELSDGELDLIAAGGGSTDPYCDYDYCTYDNRCQLIDT